MGHRVYKTKDPRANILQELARDLFVKFGSSPLYDVAAELERMAIDKLGPRGIYPTLISTPASSTRGCRFPSTSARRSSPCPAWPDGPRTGWSRCGTTASSAPRRSTRESANVPYVPMPERKPAPKRVLLGDV